MDFNRANFEDEGLFLNNGWFFLGDKYDSDLSQALGRYESPENHAEAWVEAATHISAQCQRRNIPCIFMIAPAKWSVYTDLVECLPDFIPNSKSTQDRILQVAASKSLDIMDFRRDMIDGRKIADTYSPRDSHWNAFGALLAWNKLSARLKEHFPSSEFFDAGPIQDIQSSNEWDEASNLTGSPGVNCFNYPILPNKFKSFDLRGSDGIWSKQSGFDRYVAGSVQTDTRCLDATSKLHALILRDSVGDFLMPYISSSFAKSTHRYHHVNGNMRASNISALLRDQAPDVVMIMMTERYLIYPLFDLEMARACTAFEEAHECIASWPAVPDLFKLDLDGWESPKQPVLVRFPPVPAKRYFLKISTYTAGMGALLASYTVEGQVHHKQFFYRNGANDFYLEVNGDVMGSHIWLLDQYNSDPFFYREIVLSV